MARHSFSLWNRRQVLLGLGAASGGTMLAGCEGGSWHAVNVTGSSPALQLSMVRAEDGKAVSEADYRGKIVLLYLGYTFCPDVCPTTLANLAEALSGLGKDAERVRVLFVTVDPNRDSLAVLSNYLSNFGAAFEGLRGSDDALAALARRYRLVYSVTPASAGHPYEVTHSSAIYIFDGSGAARLLVASMASAKPDIAGTTADLKRLIADEGRPGWLNGLIG